MAGSKKKDIHKWVPKPSEIFVEDNGKLFTCHFDKIFDSPNLKPLKNFIIHKSSYENQLKMITSYINYFMNFYDTDGELAFAYLKLKYAIYLKEIANELQNLHPETQIWVEEDNKIIKQLTKGLYS